MNSAVLRSVAALALCSAATLSHAGEVYTGIGLPGLMIGYAQPLNDSFTLRADFATLGSRSKNGSEEGIDYEGKIKFSRIGLFGDWFPFGNGFRFTGGVTFNKMRADLEGRPSGGTITIGDTTYAASGEDRFDVEVKFPSTTPYLGLGWGHQAGPKGGWGFAFDVGASFGKAKVRGSVSGPLLSQTVSQEDIDRELEEIRDGVGKVKAIPQLSVGVNYRF
ncbi:hypothetical protein OOT46_13810 [Aquabacterium sp. A7-Y]|uniref:hypothetical protein n=1 Tax=Aquabacterium sp. A7-Y TaxID=1349605 RepID=UPI00223D8A81|nr:hypothetical protein [Aquabacterium sp. A7-Y]MCW7538917.1 hypothetical protein [Aquabacterium sp. A7-Y]